MNGWGSPEPAWWLNLQAQPETQVELKDGKRTVSARAAVGEERDRLWAQWREYNKRISTAYAHSAGAGETAGLVILEPSVQTCARSAVV